MPVLEKEQALREGRRAVELLPLEKDAVGGAELVKYLAVVATWVDDKNLAFEQLAVVTNHPSSISYGQLKLLPFWDAFVATRASKKLLIPLSQDPNHARFLTTPLPFVRQCWSHWGLRQALKLMAVRRHSGTSCGQREDGRWFRINGRIRLFENRVKSSTREPVPPVTDRIRRSIA